jgi:hypothetical protein
MESQLFEIMRFNILMAAFNPATADRLSDDYVFAWEKRVYPFSNGEELQHKAFSSSFRIDKTMVEELAEFLDKTCSAKTVPTFYDLETKYRGQGGWDRMELVYALKYMKLANLFDDQFWTQLMKNHPAEASSISRKYEREKDLYLN